MNIAKQKTIIALSEDSHALVEEYQAKKHAALEIQIPQFLDLATSEFITFIENQGFTVTGDMAGKTKADSGDGLIITLDRKPRILSVHMPNGEFYSITVDTTLEPADPINVNPLSSQDSQIYEYKAIIENTKRQLTEVKHANYRYSLSIEPHDGDYGRDNKYYRKFSEILRIMFS